MPTIEVRRLPAIQQLGTLLAATSWPADEQRNGRYGVSHQAQQMSKAGQFQHNHPAARLLQAELDAGTSLEALFTRVLARPADTLAQQAAAFSQSAGIAAFLTESDAAWHDAVLAMRADLAHADLAGFLQRCFGNMVAGYVVTPNLLYPTDMVMSLRHAGRLYGVLPPRRAYGESPPWPFGSDPAYVHQHLAFQFVYQLTALSLEANPALRADTLDAAQLVELPAVLQARFPQEPAQFAALLAHGATAAYLDMLADGEGAAYMLFERRTTGLWQIEQARDAVLAHLNSARSGALASLLPALLDELASAES